MDRFELEGDEEFDKRCGEIFLTTKGRISFHCTLCEEAFCGYESYQAHINEVHLSTNIKLEIDEIDIAEETLELTKSLEKYLDVELNNFENKLEEMLNTTTTDAESCSDSFITEDQFRRSKIKREREININSEKITRKCTTELPIPDEIREVVKRVVYKTQSTADVDRKHKCPICGFGFKDRGNMIHHFKRHSNERKHACPECGKRFYSNTEVNSHMRCHTLERPFLCTECGRTFATKSTLGSHLKRHRDQRDYHCQYPTCQKSFYSSTLLKNHMLSHSSERRYACSECNSAFKRAIALKNHIKLHENKREYKCQICEAGFNQQAGLFSHQKTAHKSV